MSDVSKAEFGSDIVVDLMKAYGIEYAAFNPGATFRGIHDSIVNYGGNEAPEVIECCHEEVSVAIAHGYAKATGKPMAAITHNIVGLQHASMAIFNAWCDRAPVLVMGGTGPMDTSRRRPWIDWVHTALVQGNLVRDFVKWDDQPYSVAAVPDSFIRGYRLAVTEPCGPVYLCFDSDIQESPLKEPVPIPEIARFSPAPPLPPNSQALRRAAELLSGARSPVIIADHTGRNPDALAPLLELAEFLAAPVIDRGGRYNFPSTHPLDADGIEKEVLGEADVVLALDVFDLYGTLGTVNKASRAFTSCLREGALMIHISLDELITRSWSSDYQKLQAVDVPITADTSLAIPELLRVCRELGIDGERARQRYAELKEQHTARRAGWRDHASSRAGEHPIAQASLVAQVGEAVRGEDWVVSNITFNGWARRLWSWEHPHQYLGRCNGGGLGYAPGASIGAALAYRGTDKLVIDFQSDGDFLMCPSALWTASHHRLPMLFVMLNNRSYFNSEEHQAEVARTRGRDVQRRGIGTLLADPPVDFAQLARSFGLHGEGPIERMEELGPALRRALSVIKDRKMPALVDVVVQER
ncbi:MAG: thiamine pyrophosphate-binding protein [Dehalococcoidia bacterium]|nr:thiamine pyrophosphate-binding protein [Dehalococcoidia bacterium]